MLTVKIIRIQKYQLQVGYYCHCFFWYFVKAIMETHKPDYEYDQGTPGPSDQSSSLACQVSLLAQSMKEMQSNMQLLISQRLGDPLGEGYSMSNTGNTYNSLIIDPRGVGW